MTPLLIALLLFVTLILGVVAAAVLESSRTRDRVLLDAVEAGGWGRPTVWTRLESALRRTRFGRWVATTLAGSGLLGWSVAGFLSALLVATLVAARVGAALGGRTLAVAMAVIVVAGTRQWLARRQGRRTDKFIAQLPEVARLLANGAQAGLGLNRSLALAARELSEPARTELTQVHNELEVGQSMKAALDHLGERLPSRELSVLAHTVVVQQRSGGALVTALTRIATTLDERKQLRREVRTASTASAFTGATVTLVAASSVVLVNLLSPGALDAMVASGIGRIVLIVSGVLFTLGFLLMRRVTKVVV